MMRFLRYLLLFFRFAMFLFVFAVVKNATSSSLSHALVSKSILVGYICEQGFWWQEMAGREQVIESGTGVDVDVVGT